MTTLMNVPVDTFHCKSRFNHLHSISPAFYEKLLCKNSFAKKLQSQTVIREKLCKKLLHKKAAHKMLINLTPGLNFINIQHTAFSARKSRKHKKIPMT